MSVQDLTNTTWVIPYFSLSDNWIEETFSVNFSSSYYSDNFTGFGGSDSEAIWYLKNGQYEECPWDIGAQEMISDDTITITGGNDVTNTTFISWLEEYATQQGGSTVTVDLSTLSGWSNVSSGSHTLTIKAKASGYNDSPASTGVTFSKAGTLHTVVLTSDPTVCPNLGGLNNDADVYYSTDNWATLTLLQDRTTVTLTDVLQLGLFPDGLQGMTQLYGWNGTAWVYISLTEELWNYGQMDLTPLLSTYSKFAIWSDT